MSEFYPISSAEGNGVSWNVDLIGIFTTEDFANAVTITGDLAYVAAYSQGILILDVSDPSHPTEIARHDTDDYALAAVLWGDYLLVADWHDGLRIIDVSNPSLPFEVGYYDTRGYAFDVDAAGNIAFVADYLDGLRIIDISDPSHPVEIGHHNTLGNTYSIDLSGSLAYLTDYHRGLRIVDIADPAHPYEVGFIDTDSYALNVEVRYPYAYVADYWDGLRIFDVSDPSSPAEVGAFDSEGNSYAVDVAGDMAYLADYHRGLRVVDVSDPSAPREVGFYDTGGTSAGVDQEGDRIYVADGMGGLCTMFFHPSFAEISCPPDATLPANPQRTPHLLAGFTITNSSIYEQSYLYLVRAQGPATLDDNGDPSSLAGTTPLLQPGESFSPPAAALIPPANGQPGPTVVGYTVTLDQIPGYTDSCTTVVTFEVPLDVFIASFHAESTERGILLRWEVEGEVEWYSLERRRSTGGRVEVVASLDGDERSFIDTEVEGGTRYDYTLSAHTGLEVFRSRTISAAALAPGPTIGENYPNPFNPRTVIPIRIAQPGWVELAVYDTRGSLVKTLFQGYLEAGSYEYTWDGRNRAGAPAGSGVYLCRLQAGGAAVTRKMILLR